MQINGFALAWFAKVAQSLDLNGTEYYTRHKAFIQSAMRLLTSPNYCWPVDVYQPDYAAHSSLYGDAGSVPDLSHIWHRYLF